ncbi:DUF2516 family protein [Arthrobacter sp. LAPM80]|uniref:DUF2516 family protein n=1 Tax=Arthrobacter sp. LAPM80 TaxID=3141788 RepID=UPI00398A9437
MVIFLNFMQFLILVALGLLALGIQLRAFIDCLRSPAADFERVYKRTKTFWLALSGGAVFFGFLYIFWPLMSLTVPTMGMPVILNLAGVTAAGVYLADVRPALVEVRGRGKGQQNRGSSW